MIDIRLPLPLQQHAVSAAPSHRKLTPSPQGCSLMYHQANTGQSPDLQRWASIETALGGCHAYAGQ